MSSEQFRLKQLHMQPLDIGFRVAFKHASAERSRTSAVVAVATAASGHTGYGEGCPRSYVSGESVDTCLAFYRAHERELLTVQSLADVQSFAQNHRHEIDRHPAAWCALESALLDALGRHFQMSVEQLLGLKKLEGSFGYTGVLGVSKDAVFQAQLAQYGRLGFRDFKMKISGDLAADKAHLRAIEQAVPGAKIRLDGNNLWPNLNEALPYLQALSGLFWAVEEPLAPKDFDGLEDLAQRLNVPIILDESCLTTADLDIPSRSPERWLVNVRVSKMGGVLRSMDVVQACTKFAIPVVVGAQVGETSLLTRAALTVVHANRAVVAAQEGAFGTLLLKQDVAEPCLMFGAKGVLLSNQLAGNGWGLSVDPTRLWGEVPIIEA